MWVGMVLTVAYADTFEFRKFLSRQYAIHVSPFHGDLIIENVVIVKPKLKEVEKDLLHVHRCDSRQERGKACVDFTPTPNMEVKDTEARIVM